MLSKEIPPEQWIKFFDDFSKQHEGWIVNWEVLDAKLGDQEKTTRLPLVGISADVKGSKPRIDVMVGGRLVPNAHRKFSMAVDSSRPELGVGDGLN